MRQFLLNAIQLQLFKQFIDGRLDLLNASEGFRDIFEDEINMGEYAGSDKNYHQWLFTVKKGGGAIFNTVRTKANPAMKTVYKFAKDHARMGIKEVKSRLKQKELAENGYSSTADTGGTGAGTGEEGQPITAHFGQARPPRPLVAKRPRSNVGLESSPEQPQPYRSLKEAEFAEEPISGPSYTAPPSPVMEKFTDINLLGDMFSCLDEPEGQQLSLARSLEDLRIPKDPQEQQIFTYQRMDLSGSKRTCTLPGLKHSNPYNKMWSMHGQDDMALSGRLSPNWDGPQSVPPPELEEPWPPSQESFGPGVPELPDPSTTPSQGGCITIPRPQGRKTPEPGKVLGAPPVPEPQNKPGAAGEGGTTTAGGQEFRQALGMGGDLMLQPTKIDFSEGEDVDLLSLLDPLNNPAQTTTTPALAGEGADSLSGAAPPSSRTVFPSRPYSQSLPPFHQHMPLNPFTVPLGYPTHRPYLPTVAGNPFSGGACRPPASAYFHATPHGRLPHPLSIIPGLYGLSSPVGSTLPPGLGSMRPAFPNHGGPPPTYSDSHHALSSLLNSPSGPTPRVLLKPPNTTEDSETQDPFGDLLAMAKPAVAPPKKKVEDLRGKWETFD